jgi:hypothetical protein
LTTVVEKWLENEEIPVVLWSSYHRRHRTNNSIEGWNSKINSYFERPHPNIKMYCSAYKKMLKLQPPINEIDIKFREEKRKKCYINLT